MGKVGKSQRQQASRLSEEFSQLMQPSLHASGTGWRMTRRGFLGSMALSAFALAGCGNGALSQAAAESNSASSTSESTGGTLHIGFPSSGSNFNTGVLGAAVEWGYLDEVLSPLGYSVEATGFVGAAPALHEALVSGDLDLVDYAGFAGILGKSKGIDTTNLVVSSWGSIWNLAAKPEITSIADLKGKKVAYQRGASPQMYLIKLLAENGLAFSDIEAVNATIPDGLSSLSTGAVDAAVCSAGLEKQLVEQGLATTLHCGMKGDPTTYFEPFTLVGRTDFVEQSGDVVVAVLKGYLKARDEIVAKPDDFFKLASEKTGQDEEIIRAQVQENVASNYPVSLDEPYLTSLEKIQQFELENELISAEIDVHAWTDGSYLEKASS